MRSRSGDFVRKTVSLDSDIRPLIDKLVQKQARTATQAVFISRIINDFLRDSNFKNLQKYSVNPRGVGKRSRITIVVDLDNHRKIVEYTAAAIEECAINYCDEPSQSYSKVLNNVLRKELHI
jgi:hypothetical protein